MSTPVVRRALPIFGAFLPLLPAVPVLAQQAAAPATVETALQPGFARVFDDHMVLQRERPVRVWGWGAPGVSAVVRFGEQERGATVDAGGAWSVTLESMPASAEPRRLTLTLGERSFALDDVLVGDVWICGGQSNMAWTVRGTRDADLEVACADDSLLRFVRLPNEARGAPRRDYVRPEHGGAGKSWRPIDAESVLDCTGVGYYFAQRLRRHLKVPVGIVDVSWGGTSAQFWVPKPRLRELPSVAPMFETYEAAQAAWIQGGGEAGAKRRYAAAVAAWTAARDDARAAGKKAPRRPDARAFEDPSHKRHPGGGHDGMLAPLRVWSFEVPCTSRGRTTRSATCGGRSPTPTPRWSSPGARCSGTPTYRWV